MNILYLINYAGAAGTEKYVELLIRAYTAQGHRCFLGYGVEGKLSEDMRALGIPCFPISMRHPLDLGAARTLARIARENEIDVIHAQYPRENNIAVLSKLFYRRPKIVYTVHLTMQPSALWRYLLHPLFTRRNHKVIGVCHLCVEQMRACGLKPEKLTMIHNGVSQEDGQDRAYLKDAFHLHGDPFVYISAARFSPEKGLDFLVDAASVLHREKPGAFVLILAGTGELYEEIAQKVASAGLEGTVILAGYRTDLGRLLPGADVFINSASGNEACSFAILEAFAYGLPVIATNVGGNPDLTGGDTGRGFLVEYGDTEAMCRAMRTLMEDGALWREMSENARRAVREEFSAHRMAERTMEIYREDSRLQDK